MKNLQKLSQADTTRLLNSTPLGTVLGESQLRRHLQRAGYRITSDQSGKTINLLKYVAWLIDERVAAKERAVARANSVRTYDDIKEAARARSAATTSAGRDIGTIPEIENAGRRAACQYDLMKFLKTYFPEQFYLDWSSDHKIVIEKIEESVLNGGLFALAMPRGSGKTSICERAALWAVLYGHRRFVVMVGATEDAARLLLDSIKMEVECNDTLFDDFPEVCYPVRRLDGINNRSKGQTCNGVRTRITWSDDEITLPTIENSVASGSVVMVRGITGHVRGMKVASADGRSIRPDFVLVDDPQTDESAASPEQNRKRLRILTGAILGLAGPGVKIAGVMPCTVMRNGDMADEVLNKERHPEWNGERRKLLISFPENLELWSRYHEIWADSLRETGTIAKATAFYMENRAELDKGAQVSWDDRFERDEVSGVQHAMDLYFRDKETFFCEYQNEPLPDDEGETEKITVPLVWERIGNLDRGVVPEDAEHLTAFIDVQGKLLFYVVCAFADNFTGNVIDYGAFPDQRRRYFSLRDANPTFETIYPNAGLEGRIYSALTDLCKQLLARPYTREDGSELYIERCAIDSAWGTSTKTVYQFCRSSDYARILLPSKGRGVTAAMKPFSEYRRNRGEKLGFNWRIFPVRGKTTARLFEYDTNFWKSFLRARLTTVTGDKGSLTIFKGSDEQHRLFAEHLSSERAAITTGGGRRVDVWTLLAGRENHWLDGVVGCMALASACGCDLQMESAFKIKKPVVNRQTYSATIKPMASSQLGRIVPHR